MNETAAKGWIAERFGKGSVGLLEEFVALVVDENRRQNLISPTSVADIWHRHILDSAQLELYAQQGSWLDIGTGGGFPGLVVGALRPQPILLVEPRRKRAKFLTHCVATLGLRHVTVATCKVEALSTEADVISARAVASVENLLHAARPCAKARTRWLLPRGRFGETELTELQRRWAGVFHVEQSLTDPSSTILVMEGVRRR